MRDVVVAALPLMRLDLCMDVWNSWCTMDGFAVKGSNNNVGDEYGTCE